MGTALVRVGEGPAGGFRLAELWFARCVFCQVCWRKRKGVTSSSRTLFPGAEIGSFRGRFGPKRCSFVGHLGWSGIVVADALPECRNRQFSRAIRAKKVFISRPPWMVRNRRRGRSSGVPKSAAFEGNSGQKWVLLRDANVLRKTMRGRSCSQTGGGPKR